MAEKEAKQDLRSAPTLALNFTVGPGVAGAQAHHVKAAIEPFKTHGIGETSNGVISHCEGDLEAMADAIKDSIIAAFKQGATHYRFACYAKPEDDNSAQEYLDSVETVLTSLESTVIPLDQIEPSDIPLEWGGRLIAGVRERARKTDGSDTVRITIQEAEEKFGPLDNLTRKERLSVIRWLKSQGVFRQRRSVERIAVKMQISRPTIYNDLKAL